MSNRENSSNAVRLLATVALTEHSGCYSPGSVVWRGELGGLSGCVVLRGGAARTACRECAGPRLQLRLRTARPRCALHLQIHKVATSFLALPDVN